MFHHHLMILTLITLKILFHLNTISIIWYWGTSELKFKRSYFSLYHIKTCSLSKNFDELQHLLSCTNKKYDIIAITETGITKNVSILNNLNIGNYSIEFTPTGSLAGRTLLYIANHLSYKSRQDINIYKKNELESTFIEIILLLVPYINILQWILLILIVIT